MCFSLFRSRLSTFSCPSQQLLGILLSLLPFIRHLPSIRHPNSCIVVWQQLIFLVGLVNQPLYAAYWMSVVYEHQSFRRHARDATVISSHALCSVSLSTLTAISVDRLLALLLGLRYKKIVTLRRTYIILAIVWALCLVIGICSYINYRLAIRCSFVGISSCLVILVASYTKIFRALSHHLASQPNALNMVRYRKALHSAVWVQLGLIVCYVPYFTLIILCDV